MREHATRPLLTPPREQQSCAYRLFGSPVGELRAVARNGSLIELSFCRSGDARVARKGDGGAGIGVLDVAEMQLSEYFAGRRKSFDLPLELEGPDFYRRVWAELLKIPYGKTSSYGQLAAKLGAPDASRAVGAANGANPIAIIVPCHRVIGADGSLVGFGGGLNRKRFLLDLESGRARLELFPL